MKKYFVEAQTLVLRVLVQRKRSVAVELYVGVSLLEDDADSRIHCFDGGEKVASQSRYNHGGDANWNTLPSLIDDVFPDSASCRRENLLVTGGDTDLRLLQLLVVPHAAPQPWNQLVVRQVI